MGPGRRRPAVRRQRLRRAGRQAGHRPDDRRRGRRPVPVPPLGEAPADGPAYDEILDFSRAQHDQIDLRPIDAKPRRHGNQTFRFIGEHAFTHAGQLRYEATADGDFLVSGNIDRDLDADFAFVVRTGVAGLKAGDFSSCELRPGRCFPSFIARAIFSVGVQHPADDLRQIQLRRRTSAARAQG